MSKTNAQLQKAAQQALHQMAMENWNWASTASNDAKRGVYVELQKALEAEQVPSQNERIISDASASREGFYKSMFSVIHGEQAQAVEPVARVKKLVNCAIIDSTGCAECWEDLPDGTPLFTHPAPPPAGDRASLIRRADASVTALNSRIMEPFYCSLDQNAARVLSDCVDMLESDAAHMALSDLAGNAETMSIAHGMLLKLRDENKALKAQQVAVPVTILERARAMYAECPTYRGTKPLPWGNVGNDVRREWLDKARAQQVAVPAPMTDEEIKSALHLKSCEGYRAIVRAVEAHHGIGEKP